MLAQNARQLRFPSFFLIFYLLSYNFLVLELKHANASIIRDTELERGFGEIVHDMAVKAGFPNSIQVRIVVDPGYNAFVVGGRTVYVHTGLLLQARSAEEILGVIAHEIGHLAAGHVPLRSEDIKNAGIANALAAVAAAAVAVSGSTDVAIGVLMGGNDRSMRNYMSASRNDEAAADGWAVKLLDHAGISSAGLANLMRRMASQRALPQNRQSKYYQSHPGARDRLSFFEDHLSTSPHREAELPLDIEERMVRLITKARAYVIDPLIILETPVKAQWARSFSTDDIAEYAEAIGHFRRGELQLAGAKINHLTATFPADPYFHEFAGDISLSGGDINASILSYRKVLDISPDSPQVAVSLGRALIAAGTDAKLSEAIKVLEMAVAGEPDWAFAKRQLAIAYGRSGLVGTADMLLAEEAMLRGNTEQAARLARRALSHINLPQNVQARAQDVLFEVKNDND